MTEYPDHTETELPRRANSFYMLEFWFFSLVVSPFVLILASFLPNSGLAEVRAAAVFFPLFFTYGILFSVPAFLINFLLFFLLNRYAHLRPWLLKLIVSATSAVSAVFTLQYADIITAPEFIAVYAVCVFVIGMVLPLRMIPAGSK